jgi:hypothetical protein
MTTPTIEQIQYELELARQTRDQAVQTKLARLLSTENIYCEFRKVETASFNVKSRVLIMPVFAAGLLPETVTMLTGHEVGHAKWTPVQGWHGSISERGIGYKTYLNVVEDARIERLMKEAYYGLRRDFHIGYSDLLAKKFFGDLNSYYEGPFIDRFNVFCKTGEIIKVFSEKEQEFLARAKAMISWEDVVALADDLAAHDHVILKNQYAKGHFGMGFDEFIKEMRKRMREGNHDLSDYQEFMSYTPESHEEELDALDDKPFDFGEDDDTPEPQTNTKKDDPYKVVDEDPINEDVKPSPAQLPQQPVKSDDNSFDAPQIRPVNSTPDSITSFSDEIYREREKSLVDSSDIDVRYVHVAKDLPFDRIIPWKKVHQIMRRTALNNISARHGHNRTAEGMEEELNTNVTSAIKKFKKRHDKYIYNLLRIFEMKKNAERYARSHVAKTGALNFTKMHQYKYNDDIFKKITIVPDGQNHGIMMYIDFSGSMSKVIRSVVEQAAIMCMFAKRANIPFRVYGFTTVTFWGKTNQWGIKKETGEAEEKEEEFEFANDSVAGSAQDIFMFEIFSEKMPTKVFNEMLMVFASTRANYNIVDENLSMGATPLDTAILMIPHMHKEFVLQTKVQKVSVIILTDGDATDRILGYPGKEYTIVTTPWNRKTFTVPPAAVGDWSSSKITTKLLLDIVREYTGARFIGYHLLTGNMAQTTINEYSRYTKESPDALKDTFRKQYFFTVPNFGFDEYFFLWDKAVAKDASDREVDDRNDLDDIETRTNKGLANAYTKLKTESARSRIFATKFMELISA